MFLQGKLSHELPQSVGVLLDEADKGTCHTIYDHFDRVESSLLKELAEFELDEVSQDEMISSLRTCGKRLIISKVEEKAESVIVRMTSRYNSPTKKL